MAQSRIQIAKPDILRAFDELPTKVLKQKDIARILGEQRGFWRLAQNTTTPDFIAFLERQGKLRRLNFPFPYRAEQRFTWGDVPLLEVLLTLKKDSYYTHYTAMRMHGLTEQIPKTIYLNHEQRPHTPNHDSLQQSTIDNAFRAKPRVSNNIVEFGDVRIMMINGMNTGQLGVISQEVTYDDDQKIRVRVTNIERTLIDIAVRPVYAGGVNEVLNAYRLAQGRFSVNRLSAMLQQMNFVYPYHQAIGYYLEKAGYKPSMLDLLRRFPMKFDFYLTHQMGKPHYVKEWRLFVPEGF